MKPVLCSECSERFPDTVTYGVRKQLHTQGRQTNNNASDSRKLHFKTMTVSDLKRELQSRQLNTTGNKDILISCLKAALAGEVK